MGGGVKKKKREGVGEEGRESAERMNGNESRPGDTKVKSALN